MGNPGKIYPHDGFGMNSEGLGIDPLSLEPFRTGGLDVHVLRLDKIHPEISGNKWFKLKYYLEAASTQRKEKLISFGGPYSNHLVALASAAHASGFSSLGFVRGERPAALSHTLLAAMKYGMDLQFISREMYRQKNDPAFLTTLAAEHPNALVIPEGGLGDAGIRGAGEILSLADFTGFSHIACAVGTGTTIAGLLTAARPGQRLIGISVLRGTRGIEPLQSAWLQNGDAENNLEIIHDYHFGGYAKYQPALLDFMNDLYDRQRIPSDFVYTGKLFFAVAALAGKKYFPGGSRLLLLYSGGLQGNGSLPRGLLHF
jgi:1-aminocyclopropane-1-carboxylate deaminase